MAPAKIHVEIDVRLKNFQCYHDAHVLNEYAKEEKEKNTTDWLTFFGILLKKRCKFLLSINLA